MYVRETTASAFLLLLCVSQAAKVPEQQDRELPEKLDFLEINKGLKGLIGGDILPTKSSTRNTIVAESYFWPSTSIPINYGLGLSLEAIGSIELARQEYRLRTCLDFVDRTTESDYINFRSLSGCYSNVGRVGGGQTLSIGSGCEVIGTVCHEMMHAIGIWHEQSRPDRDDYVEIMWEDITEGYENNFNKYDFETADPRRVPYDYTSVMHYSSYGFSSNGRPTIVTRDAGFQNTIGQRFGFSQGDTEKINRMYQCSDTLLYSYNCNFDDESACGYNNDYTDDTDWIVYFVGDKTVTVPTSAPTMDATFGLQAEGAYMIMDTSAKTAGNLESLKSMRHLSKSSQQCLQFYYFISKDASSDAAVSVEIGTLNEDTGEILSTSPLLTLSDDTSGKWVLQRMTIGAPSEYRLVFKGKTAIYEDTFAIDDVSVMDKQCDDAYFVVDDYSQVLADTSSGESILSDVMTTTQGYNFRIKLYPRGTNSAETGYMSAFFGLVQGPNDDTLDWPFCNKYIRLMVVDQNNNPLYAMRKSSEFLTSQSVGGDLWNKPTSETSAGYLGYSNFMKTSDVQNKNNYLKLDRLVFSVLVQDMNWVNNEVCTGSFTRTVDSPAIPMKLSAGEANIFDVPDKSNDRNRDDDEDDCDDNKHDNNDEPDYDGYMSVGAAIGLALGIALLVILAMLAVMRHMSKSHKKQLKALQSTVVAHPQLTSQPQSSSHPQSGSPPSYSASQVHFEKLPAPEV